MTTAGARPGAAPAGWRPAASKVPEVTAWFWIIKILTTGMGEATSDFLVHRINPVVAVGLGFAGLVIALVLQFAVRRYMIWIYWLAVTMVAVFGTMEADVLHVGLGIPYRVSTAGFAVVLALIFVIWFASEKTLSIHSIRTRRRELFYWATVMTTFALGTAAGDLTAYTLHLGFFASGVMFAVAIVIPALGYRWLRFNPVLAFWFAYILTRPLGASFADWLGVPHSLGGVGLGRGPVSLSLTLLIAVLLGGLALTGRDMSGARGRTAARPVAASRAAGQARTGGWAGHGPQASQPHPGWATQPAQPHPGRATQPAQPGRRGQQGPRGKGGRHRADPAGRRAATERAADSWDR